MNQEPQVAYAPGVAPPSTRQRTTVRYNRRSNCSPPRRMTSILMSAPIPPEARMSFTWCMGTTLTERLNYIDDLKEQNYMCQNNVHLPEAIKEAQDERLRITEEWFAKERRCIVAFRYLVARWLYIRYKDRKLNEEDPATLAPPTKPMILYDSTQRGTYCFELTTIRRRCETALTFAQWMFPEPRYPSNPLTNLPFTTGQMMTILQACRNAGFGSWLLEAYRRTTFNLKGFLNLHLTPLKLRALDDICRNDTSEEFQDLMTDFVEDHHQYHRNVFNSHLKILKWAIIHEPNTEYMKKWVSCFRRMHYLRIVHAHEMNQPVLDALDDIYDDTLVLFNDYLSISAIGQRRLRTLPRRRTAVAIMAPEPVAAVLPAVLVAVQGTDIIVDTHLQPAQLADAIVRDLIEELINANPPEN